MMLMSTLYKPNKKKTKNMMLLLKKIIRIKIPLIASLFIIVSTMEKES